MPGMTEWTTMLTKRGRGVNFEEVSLFERTEAEKRQQGDVVDLVCQGLRFSCIVLT